ncbi:hypothetical protein EJ06DRAFT_53862 [Trichodelitschia bisporula]|uniref:Uncharacterized protein n=1 Tax=Trichodelitschia bisporula TaxID=703511 RepID=A0A6G1HUG8_9PEZI|nr:hypothetical protein EJ06DRAFT_53862 [Trichodelitschia bisporula]
MTAIHSLLLSRLHLAQSLGETIRTLSGPITVYTFISAGLISPNYGLHRRSQCAQITKSYVHLHKTLVHPHKHRLYIHLHLRHYSSHEILRYCRRGRHLQLQKDSCDIHLRAQVVQSGDHCPWPPQRAVPPR